MRTPGRAVQVFLCSAGQAYAVVRSCRLATAGLLVILCMLYPQWYMAALLTLMLDILSHWTHMYATLVAGSSTHKVLLLHMPSKSMNRVPAEPDRGHAQDVNSKNIIIRFYYSSRIFMGFCCICCEVLYMALYLWHWQPEATDLTSGGESALLLPACSCS